MVTIGEAVQDEVVSEQSQQRKSPNSGYHELPSNQEENTLSAFPKKEASELQKTQPPSAVFSASKCNEGGNTHSVLFEKVVDNVEQKQSSESTSRDQASQSNQVTPLYVIPVRVLKSEDHTCDANQVGTSPSLIDEKLSDNLPPNQGSDAGVHASQSNEEGRDCIGPRVLQHYQEGRNPSRISGKASEDGYNWRKYGQKLVKGNEFIRSYYRCTHPNCTAKRQVECSQDGRISDNIYLGKHEHPKPQSSPQRAVGSVLSIHAKRQDEPSLAIGEDKSSAKPDLTSQHAEPIETPRLPTIPPTVDAAESEISQSNRTRDVVDQSGILDSKRQKRDICNIGETSVEKPNGEPRVVVQTMSEFDIVNDGYRWRKYGQKLVKGNPNPRSYYRCSNAGCPVKKHVERASHDPKVVITTYEGQHGHDMPPSRTVTPNTAGAYSNITSLDDESRSAPEANGAVCLDVVVDTSAN